MNNQQIITAAIAALGGGGFVAAVGWAAVRAKFSDLLEENKLYKEFKKDTKKEIDLNRKEISNIRGSWMEMATQGLTELANRINIMQSDLHKELHENSMKYSEQLSEIKTQLATIIGRLESDRDRR